MEFIMIKIGKLPGTIKEVALNGDRTVAAALEAAEISETDGYELRVNGNTAESETELYENDIVLMVKKIKGN